MSPTRAFFPYINWLQAEGFRHPFSMTASGMSPPDPALLAPALARGEALDLAPPGLDARPAVEARLAELFGTSPERVLLDQGASGAMHTIAWTLFPGAHVVTEVPSYEPFRALAELYGGSSSFVERPAPGGSEDYLESVRSALAERGSRPAHLFLCNPHNPTGHILGAEEIRSLARLAAEAGGLLVMNESYMEFARPADRIHAFRLAPNAISLASLTKAYGLGALRTGWLLLGDDALHHRDALIDRGHLVGMDPPTPCLRIARAALDRLGDLLAPLRTLEHRSRPHLERWLRESEFAEGTLPPLGLCAFPRIRGVEDTRALTAHLAEAEGVGVVPGEYFAAPGHLRISYALPEATLVEALDRLERGIASYLS
ncbi:MAG TPA: pyridoxal phosphate-dependent aminotransferase [Planctomycetes bacterium]|nr:pyridoxal phosphate-dependent aminotransferase [Planctomycetota bacterium]